MRVEGIRAHFEAPSTNIIRRYERVSHATAMPQDVLGFRKG